MLAFGITAYYQNVSNARPMSHLTIISYNHKFIMETWRVMTISTKKVQTLFSKCLRRILRVYWTEVITNRDLCLRTGHEPINTTIKTRHWKWIGHTLRRGEKNIASHTMDWNPQGARNVADQESRGTDLTDTNLSWYESKRAAQDRQRRKAVVDALCPPPPPPWDKED